MKYHKVTYQEFISEVSADLGINYKPEMISGFSDNTLKPGGSYEFFFPNMPRYLWNEHQDWYYSSGADYGVTLEDAKRVDPPVARQ
jgi:hypothetical protein